MYEELIRSAGKASPQEILLAESRVGVNLPESFKAFSLEKDGAYFKDAEIKAQNLQSKQSLYGVRRIIPVRELGTSFVENWDDKLIAFAEDSSGNYFVFLKKEMDFVYFWDHETDEIELTSNSFDDFLRSIKRSDNNVVPAPINAKVWINPEFLKKIKNKEES